MASENVYESFEVLQNLTEYKNLYEVVKVMRSLILKEGEVYEKLKAELGPDFEREIRGASGRITTNSVSKLISRYYKKYPHLMNLPKSLSASSIERYCNYAYDLGTLKNRGSDGNHNIPTEDDVDEIASEYIRRKETAHKEKEEKVETLTTKEGGVKQLRKARNKETRNVAKSVLGAALGISVPVAITGVVGASLYTIIASAITSTLGIASGGALVAIVAAATAGPWAINKIMNLVSNNIDKIKNAWAKRKEATKTLRETKAKRRAAKKELKQSEKARIADRALFENGYYPGEIKGTFTETSREATVAPERTFSEVAPVVPEGAPVVAREEPAVTEVERVEETPVVTEEVAPVVAEEVSPETPSPESSEEKVNNYFNKIVGPGPEYTEQEIEDFVLSEVKNNNLSFEEAETLLNKIHKHIDSEAKNKKAGEISEAKVNNYFNEIVSSAPEFTEDEIEKIVEFEVRNKKLSVDEADLLLKKLNNHINEEIKQRQASEVKVSNYFNEFINSPTEYTEEEITSIIDSEIKNNNLSIEEAEMLVQKIKEYVDEETKGEEQEDKPEDVLETVEEALVQETKEITNLRDALQMVKENPLNLQHCTSELRKNQQLVLEAVNRPNGGQAFQYADESLQRNREFVKMVLVRNGSAIRYVDRSLTAYSPENKELMMIAVKTYPQAINQPNVDKKYFSDKDVAKAIVINNDDALQHVADDFRADNDIILESLVRYPYSARHILGDREQIIKELKPELVARLNEKFEKLEVKERTIQATHYIRAGVLTDADINNWDKILEDAQKQLEEIDEQMVDPLPSGTVFEFEELEDPLPSGTVFEFPDEEQDEVEETQVQGEETLKAEEASLAGQNKSAAEGRNATAQKGKARKNKTTQSGNKNIRKRQSGKTSQDEQKVNEEGNGEEVSSGGRKKTKSNSQPGIGSRRISGRTFDTWIKNWYNDGLVTVDTQLKYLYGGKSISQEEYDYAWKKVAKIYEKENQFLSKEDIINDLVKYGMPDPRKEIEGPQPGEE